MPFRMVLKTLVFVSCLLPQVWQIGPGRVSHGPAFRVLHLFPAFQAANKGEEPVVGLSLKENPTALTDIVVKRSVTDRTIGGEDTNSRVRDLPEAACEDVDVFVVLKLMDFVEHDEPGA